MPLLPLPPAALDVAMAQGRFMSELDGRRRRGAARSAYARGAASAEPARGWQSPFNRKSYWDKRELIQQPWIMPMAAQNLAAVVVQRLARGGMGRFAAGRRWLALQGQGQGGGAPAGESAGGDGDSAGARSQLDKYLARIEEEEERADAAGVEPPIEVGFQTWCALRLQAWWRMVLARPRLARLAQRRCWMRFSMYHIGAMQLQYFWRSRRAARLEAAEAAEQQARGQAEQGAEGGGWGDGEGGEWAEPLSPEEAAARALQRVWRRYTNLRIFRYYRDLVAFRNEGDPRTMLRAVNPREAGLIDAAAGVRVRFRLGGRQFPPTIYYKIFTHNALCDVGAFAPRDYVGGRRVDQAIGGTRLDPPPAAAGAGGAGGAGGGRGQGSIRVGGARFAATSDADAYAAAGDEDFGAGGRFDGWYVRAENNGWRPVTVKSLEEAESDPVTAITGDKASKFHFSKVKRRADQEARRRQKKRDWMRQMYSLGGGGGGGEGEGERAGAPGVAERKQPAPRAADEFGWKEEDYEAGEGSDTAGLLEWSGALDYDGYVAHWKGMATTAPSDFKPELAAAAAQDSALLSASSLGTSPGGAPPQQQRTAEGSALKSFEPQGFAYGIN